MEGVADDGGGEAEGGGPEGWGGGGGLGERWKCGIYSCLFNIRFKHHFCTTFVAALHLFEKLHRNNNSIHAWCSEFYIVSLVQQLSNETWKSSRLFVRPLIPSDLMLRRAHSRCSMSSSEIASLILELMPF